MLNITHTKNTMVGNQVRAAPPLLEPSRFDADVERATPSSSAVCLVASASVSRLPRCSLPVPPSPRGTTRSCLSHAGQFERSADGLIQHARSGCLDRPRLCQVAPCHHRRLQDGQWPSFA